ncbi:MAG: OmpH family outer membrane protein [Verrucomicrobia bacterium]|nr:OmpH family outer membrane protein [Verrucomicrobiota bacterium]
MHKVIKSILALAVAGVFAASVQAQPAPKVFVVDIAKLYEGHFKTEEQNAKLRSDEQKAEEQLQQINGEGQALVKQAQDLQEQLKNPTLSSDGKTKAQQDLQAKAEEIRKKQDEVNNFRANTQRQLQQRINSFKQLLLDEISKIAIDIAKKKGATLLLDKSGPSMIGISNILYFDSSYDITDEVSKEINKDRPAAAMTPAAPAAAIPASKPASSSDSTPSVTFPGAKK